MDSNKGIKPISCSLEELQSDVMLLSSTLTSVVNVKEKIDSNSISSCEGLTGDLLEGYTLALENALRPLELNTEASTICLEGFVEKATKKIRQILHKIYQKIKDLIDRYFRSEVKTPAQIEKDIENFKTMQETFFTREKIAKVDELIKKLFAKDPYIGNAISNNGLLVISTEAMGIASAVEYVQLLQSSLSEYVDVLIKNSISDGYSFNARPGHDMDLKYTLRSMAFSQNKGPVLSYSPFSESSVRLTDTSWYLQEKSPKVPKLTDHRSMVRYWQLAKGLNDKSFTQMAIWRESVTNLQKSIDEMITTAIRLEESDYERMAGLTHHITQAASAAAVSVSALTKFVLKEHGAVTELLKTFVEIKNL